MAKVAEGIARAAGGIAAGGRRRKELAIEVKAATKSRRSEVRSLLASLTGARGRASREQMAEMKKAARARRGEIRSLMARLKTSRRVASRTYQREANAANGARKAEVSALLTQLFRERVELRRHRQALATTLRHKAAAFMRDLTSGVAALRDGFAKEGRDRAAGIRGRLLAYGLGHREAIPVWRESLGHGRGAGTRPGEAGQPPAAETRVADRPPPPARAAGEAYEVAAAQTSDQAARSGRHASGALGHRGSAARHGRSSK